MDDYWFKIMITQMLIWKSLDLLGVLVVDVFIWFVCDLVVC